MWIISAQKKAALCLISEVTGITRPTYERRPPRMEEGNASVWLMHAHAVNKYQELLGCSKKKTA
jgi:hypothetical protein